MIFCARTRILETTGSSRLGPIENRRSHTFVPPQPGLSQPLDGALAMPQRPVRPAPHRLAGRPRGIPAKDIVPFSYCEFSPSCASIPLNQRANSRNHHRIGQGKLTIPKGRTRCEAGVQSHGSRSCGTTGLPKAEEPRTAWQPAPEAPGAGFAVRVVAWLT